MRGALKQPKIKITGHSTFTIHIHHSQGKSHELMKCCYGEMYKKIRVFVRKFRRQTNKANVTEGFSPISPLIFT